MLENIHASAQQLFAAEHFQVEALKHALKEEELIQKISDVHVLGIRSKTQVSAQALAAGKPTPIVYDTKDTPADIIKEDKIIEAYPLPVSPSRLKIVSASTLFEK